MQLSEKLNLFIEQKESENIDETYKNVYKYNNGYIIKKNCFLV